MKHTIECEARGSSKNNLCDGCLIVGDETPSTHCYEDLDEGNGYISLHYCNDCFDSIMDVMQDDLRQPMVCQV